LPELLFTLGFDIKVCHRGTVYELFLSRQGRENHTSILSLRG